MLGYTISLHRPGCAAIMGSMAATLPHLLIVDDDREICALLTKFMVRHGAPPALLARGCAGAAARRRVRPAAGLSRSSAARALARPAPRPGARPQRLGLRPQRRRPGEPAQAQDRARPGGAAAHPDRARRRLYFQRCRRGEWSRALRVIPDRIATRLAAAIVLSLVATQVINGVVYFALLGSSDPEFAGHVLLERFAAIARIIDRAAPEERPHFVAGPPPPPMGLALGTEPPKREPTHSPQLDHARQEIQRALEDPDRNVLIFKGIKDNSEGGSAWVELSNGGWPSLTVAHP